jgi:hypothetical protein
MNALHVDRFCRVAVAVALAACVVGCPPARGPFQWAQTGGGFDADRATAVAPRLAGGAYLCGQFTGSAVFGAGQPGETTLTANGGPYDTDIFIARYEADGTLDWAVSAGGAQDDSAADIVQLADGSIVVTGYFHGSATFGAGETNETQLEAAGTFDQNAFVARYTSGGALIWAQSEGGPGDGDAGTSLSAFPDGSFVVTGTFEGSAVFDTATPRPTVLNAGGTFDTDIFLARYERNGSLVWVTSAGGPAPDVAPAVATTPGGDIVLTGTFEDYAVFGAWGGPRMEIQACSSIDRDVFIARYRGNGTVAWVRNATGIDIDQGLGVAAFLDGSVMVTGSFTDRITFAPGTANEVELTAQNRFESDAFLARYDRNGNLAWARQTRGSDGVEGIAVAAIPGGSCVLAGTFTTSITLGAGEANETTLNTAFAYESNLFLARYNAAGRLEAAMRVPAIGGASDVVISPAGGVLAAGWIAGGTTLYDTTGAPLRVSSMGAEDAFVARVVF